jgi:CMP-N,N'-diacetyllegionaminic acid synthase
MRILGLIPARGGSKSIPRKNIKLLEGKELIHYTIETGLSCSLIHELIVSTDDEDIAKVSRNKGAKVPFLRPTHLATDKSPSIDTVIHALQYFEDIGQPFDAVCLLQPTTPFRDNDDLKNAIEKFIKQDADSLISVREVPHTYNPHWIFEEKEDGFLKISTGESNIISRRQDLPKSYYRDGAIYITKAAVILEQKSLYGNTIIHYEMKASSAINIDTLADWKMAEAYIKKKLNK